MSMTAFPMDSQVSEIGEDGLPVYDRAFSSSDLREVMKAYFGNGYFAEDGTSLNVKAGDGLNVIVQAGKANIQGTLGFMSEDETLRLDNPDKTNPRIDTVVVRLDLSLEKRCIELDVIHGTAAASPVAPTLTRSESVYELGLADVTIPANAAAVADDNIKDTRLDAERCGVVEPFAKLDTTSLFEQVTAIINRTSEDTTAQVGKLEKATTDAVSAMNDALSSTVLGSVWRLQSSSTADYLAYGDDLNNITGVGSKFCESASIAGGIQNKPAEVTGAFALYTFATETDPSRLGQMILTVDGGGVAEFTRAGAGSSWSAWEKVGSGTKLGTVTAVGTDYTLTATVDGEGVTMPYTTACGRASVGDSVLVSQVAGTSYATDVLATSNNSPYVKDERYVIPLMADVVLICGKDQVDTSWQYANGASHKTVTLPQTVTDYISCWATSVSPKAGPSGYGAVACSVRFIKPTSLMLQAAHANNLSDIWVCWGVIGKTAVG